MIPEINLGDVVRLKKPHPCGATTWRVVRLGADIGLDYYRKLIRIYDMDVPFNDLDALRGFLDKGDPCRTSAYGLNSQAAGACKEV